MSILTNAEDFLARSIKQAAGSDVVFTRGSTSIPMKAAFGKRVMEVRDANGAIMVANIRTAIVTTSDLQGLTPKAGDRLVSGDEKWVVGFPGFNVSFEYVGSTKTMMRIYLRRDDEENEAG